MAWRKASYPDVFARPRCSRCVEDEGDAAGDEVAGGFAGVEFDEVDGEVDVVGAQDQAVGEEVDIAQGEVGSVADGVEGSLVGAVGHQRGVVAIEQYGCIGQKKRFHRQGVGRGDAHGDKALPGTAGCGGARTQRFQETGRRLEHGVDGGGPDVGLKERHGVGDDGDGTRFAAGREGSGLLEGGQEVGGGHVLGGEDAVKRFEGELALAAEEVGEMGLAQSGLARQKGHADRASLNPAQQFKAQPLMHLSKVHLWKIRRQPWRSKLADFSMQYDLG